MQLNTTSFALRSLALASTLAFSQYASAAATPITFTNGYTATIQGSVTAPSAGASTFNTVLAAQNVAPGGFTNTGITNSTTTSGAVYSNGTDAKVTLIGEAGIVNGSKTNAFAAPTTGASGTPITTNYFSTNTVTNSRTVFSPDQTPVTTPASVTAGGAYILSFNAPQPNGAAQNEKYLGLLWGSIGTGDLLTFYSGGALVGYITGTQAQAAATAFNPANGAQGAYGSQYMVINFLNGSYDTVMFSQSSAAAFEAGNLQFSTSNVGAVPEPGSVALLGIGLAGIAGARRRKAVKA